MRKEKLALFDLDGTLFDTRYINYHAYQKALSRWGYDIDFNYFASQCNGKHYTEFLPKIVNTTKNIEQIHNEKKNFYKQFLNKSIMNEALFDIIMHLKNDYYIAVVTTASRKNTEDLLGHFKKNDEFDLIITHEDVHNVKPDPEGYLLAMEHFQIAAGNTIIFEDSLVGIEAATKSGAQVFVVKGYA